MENRWPCMRAACRTLRTLVNNSSSSSATCHRLSVPFACDVNICTPSDVPPAHECRLHGARTRVRLPTRLQEVHVGGMVSAERDHVVPEGERVRHGQRVREAEREVETRLPILPASPP